MRTISILLIILLNLIGNSLSAQKRAIDARYQGNEIGLRKFIAQNLKYPSLSLENGLIGYSITGITITPGGEIADIFTINPIDDEIERDIKRVLTMTKRKWVECDSISTNQTFYIQIVYTMNPQGDQPTFNNPVKDKYDFIEPVVITAFGLSIKYLPESDESIAMKIGKELKKNEFGKALSYVNESIRRNPFNKELYQLRISINRKLNKNDRMIEDAQKLQNFIPGVSLDELLN